MPINLRYGQQAVARGFINQQRLQQVLAKQKELAAKGKKVSVRMILEKAKLLDAAQLSQIDHDLNIKVVKKQTGKMDRKQPPPRKTTPPKPAGAQNFAGDDEVPQFGGMGGPDVDVTVFSPPPADMQERIRAERDKAKAEARRKQDDEAAAFMGDDDASPFGGDPFSDDAMSPEPSGAMEPEPFGGDDDMKPEPFGDEMQPEADAFGGDLQPHSARFGDDDNLQPQGGGFDDDEMQPQSSGFGDDDMQPEAAGFGDDDAFAEQTPNMRELSRMDSSPKLSALSAEVDGFTSPEDEELPAVSDFESDEAPAQPSWQEQKRSPAPAYPGPPSASLNPAEDDFGSFGNDIRSPEELEAAPGGREGSMDATLFSPPPSPRQKTGAMERTMFSPPPPGFRKSDRQAPAPEPEPEPEGEPWGETGLDADAGFGDEGSLDATVFSPPPADMEERVREATRESKRPSARGRQGHDDFADIDLPTGKRMDDVPTAPAEGDSVHPLRRGVGTSSSGIPRRTTSRKVAVPDDFGGDDDAVDTSLPQSDFDEGPPAKGPGKLPPKAPTSGLKDKKRKPEPPPKGRKPEPKPKKEKGEKKKTSSRVMLLFLLLLVIVLALLITPVAYPNHGIPQLTTLRNHEYTKPTYDKVDEIYNEIARWFGLSRDSGTSGSEKKFVAPPVPKGNTAQPPANTETPADGAEPPAESGG